MKAFSENIFGGKLFAEKIANLLFAGRKKDIRNKTKLDLIGRRDEVGSGGQGVGLQDPRRSRGRPTGSQGVKG